MVEPRAVGVERSTGEVFVGDVYTGYVDVFSASGVYETRFGEGVLDPVGIAVDESSGDVYVAEAFQEVVVVYAPDGTGGYRLLAQWSGKSAPGGEFGEVTGVAVDNSSGPSAGDVYVVEGAVVGSEGGAVDVFRPVPNPVEGEGVEGQYLGRLSGVKLERPNGIAVSAGTGRIVVADSVKGAVFTYSPEGVFEEKLNGKSSPNGPFDPKGLEPSNVAAVAVDEGTGAIYVVEAERDVVSQYSSSGAWEGWITGTPEEPMGKPAGVALGKEGDVYVTDAGLAVVDRFGPEAVVPSVATGKVAKTTLTRTTAVLAGMINGEGKAAQYGFHYGETPSLGHQTETASAGTGEASVSVQVTGLQAGRMYYYRIVGENENGTNVGVVRSFETPAAVEVVTTGPVRELQPEEVTVTGTLNPAGLDTHYYFQWGPTNAYGDATPAAPGTDAGAGTSVIEAATLLSRLQPNSTYHYRLVADNEFGVSYGLDQTFTTSGPPRIIYQPATEITQTAATIHAQIDPDQLATSYRFQYGETTAYGSEAPFGGETIGSGSLFVARSATLTGLKVGVTYHYRVLAENSAGITDGPDQTVTTVASVAVDAIWTSDVSASEATLHAQINPLGNDTRYYFQYSTQRCRQEPSACTNTPALPGKDIGSGTKDVEEGVKLTGLQPDTSYYFRVVASNTLGTTEGAEGSFTTQQRETALALADHRAWEMVTPSEKGGAPVEALTREGGVILAAANGNALTYVVNGAFGEEVQGNRSPEMQQIIATRGPNTWRSQDIATPYDKPEGLTAGSAPEYQFFTPSLSNALVEPAMQGAEPPLAPGVKQATIYLRDNTTGEYLPIVSEANTALGTEFGDRVHFVSATPGLDHVMLTSEVALLGPSSVPGLYEWANGVLALVSIRPSGKPAKGVSGEVELGFFGRVLTHAISTDGSRVIWTKKEENGGRGHLYLRDTQTGQTIELDAAQGVAEPSSGSAEFQAASSDASRVFFTDRQRLTPDATTEVGQAQTAGKPDLYECEIREENGKLTCELKDLTVDANPGEHANVQGLVLGAGEDGSSLYLIAQGMLAGNGNGNDETAASGRDNLYELHYDGARWTRTFIATLSSEDSTEWEGGRLADAAFLTARVSPNGRYLAFMSAAPITGYDNIDASLAAHGARDEEVFLYDAATASLRCVSCDPSGARPNGVHDVVEAGEGLGLVVDRPETWVGHWLAGSIPGWTAQSIASALYQSRYLSDQGRLYFNSPADLVAAATNGKEDVYEYEPSGVGSCQSASGGCVALISDGGSDHESAFMEATPNGSNVFFLTEAQLLPQDTDTAFDIYDARECTGVSPCLTPPETEETGCERTATCRPAQPAQPIPGGPSGTATFSGPGNIVAKLPVAKHEVEARKATRPLTRTQRLVRALKSCRERYQHATKRRIACERKARKRYGSKHKSKRSSRQNRKAGKKSNMHRLGRGR
jgi:hypothetical protein